VNLQGDLKSDLNTDGRTDGRTYGLVQLDSTLAAVDAHARTADRMTAVGELLASGSIWRTDERHPVVRSGERDEIPVHVRSAVWWRDRGRCELCQAPIDGPWHLDHITPWSAGGSDRTTNLRILCEPHNLQRSNHVDPTERPRMAATWWCLNCHRQPWEIWHESDGTTRARCPRHGFGKACRVRRGLEWALDNDLPDWHARDGIDEAAKLTIAYCAHCDAPGLTDQPL
jgi:hypothetical protein